jgi:hypothetical protein
MTFVTLETKGNKKTLTFNGKTYEFTVDTAEDLSFMDDKNAVDPLIEMLGTIYEYGKNNQSLAFVQR